jgi:hypothetical protein
VIFGIPSLLIVDKICYIAYVVNRRGIFVCVRVIAAFDFLRTSFISIVSNLRSLLTTRPSTIVKTTSAALAEYTIYATIKYHVKIAECALFSLQNSFAFSKRHGELLARSSNIHPLK